MPTHELEQIKYMGFFKLHKKVSNSQCFQWLEVYVE